MSAQSDFTMWPAPTGTRNIIEITSTPEDYLSLPYSHYLSPFILTSKQRSLVLPLWGLFISGIILFSFLHLACLLNILSVGSIHMVMCSCTAFIFISVTFQYMNRKQWSISVNMVMSCLQFCLAQIILLWTFQYTFSVHISLFLCCVLFPPVSNS